MNSSTAPEVSLDKIQLASWFLLLGMTVCCWLSVSSFAALSILIGGILANLSFLLLKRDLTRILAGEIQAAKARFFIRYYARFTALALLLFFLVKYRVIHNIALLVGLSTVFLSIGLTTIILAKKTILNAKEAS